MDDVKRAQIGSQMYTKYPRQMLLARASAELIRAMCPDVLGGIASFAEEVEGIIAEQGQVEVGCDFCGAQYHFDPVDAAGLFTGLPADLPPGVVH